MKGEDKMTKAIIMIHGFLTDKNDFNPFYNLAKKYYDKIVMVAIPGHGEDLNCKNFTVENVIEKCHEAYQNVKEYTIIDVIGFSMGGALATYLASKYKFHKIVLLAPANKYINVFTLFPTIVENISFFTKPNTFKKIKNDDINESDYMTTLYLTKEVILPKTNPHYLLNFIKLIRKINNELQDIHSPILLIWGDRDTLVPKTTIKHIKKYAKGEFKLHIIPKMSHLMFHSTEYQQILDAIIPFLQLEEILVK